MIRNPHEVKFGETLGLFDIVETPEAEICATREPLVQVK